MNANGTVGVVRGGRVEFPAPAPWPEGTNVRVLPVDDADRVGVDDWQLPPEAQALLEAERARVAALSAPQGMTEEEQVGSPEAIAAWQAAELARPQLSPEDLAAWEKDWAAHQAFLKTGDFAHLNGRAPS